MLFKNYNIQYWYILHKIVRCISSKYNDSGCSTGMNHATWRLGETICCISSRPRHGQGPKWRLRGRDWKLRRTVRRHHGAGCLKKDIFQKKRASNCPKKHQNWIQNTSNLVLQHGNKCHHDFVRRTWHCRLGGHQGHRPGVLCWVQIDVPTWKILPVRLFEILVCGRLFLHLMGHLSG